MTERRTEQDRRSEPRYPVAGRVLWGKPGRSPSCLAWLSDASASSASFITANHAHLTVGAQVQLAGSKHAARHYRVTRLAPYDDKLSLVACRASAPDVAESPERT